MKKAKLLTALVGVTLLAGCGGTIKIDKGDDNLIDFDSDYVTQQTLQQLFDKTYAAEGPKHAFDQLVVEMGKKAAKDASRSDESIQKRVNKLFYEEVSTASTYLTDSKFDEEKLSVLLATKGYQPGTCTDKSFYKGLVGNQADFYNKLKCDYAPYKKATIETNVYKAILNEEYILNEKKDLFKNKEIRQVESFIYKASKTSIETEYNKIFGDMINSQLDTVEEANALSFETLTNADNKTMTQIWKDQLVKEVEADIAKIASNDAAISESERKTLIEKYTSSGAYTLAYGKQLELDKIAKQTFTDKKVVTNDDVPFDATINKFLFKVEEEETTSGGVTTPGLFKGVMLPSIADKDSFINTASGSVYFIKVKVINEKTEDLELRRLGAEALAKNSANVSKAVESYLKKYNVSYHDQDLYDYVIQQYPSLEK